MGYLNTPGKFNNNTWLIDAIFKNPEGEFIKPGFAAYLIKIDDGKNCLINPSSRSGAHSIYRKLKGLNSWPLDLTIITHSHWDHTQGMIFLRKKAEEQKIPPIKVMASEKAVHYLNNQSYNQCFVQEEFYSDYLNILDVNPLKDKQEIRLSNDFLLEIHETPGHMVDHISVYDKQNSALFVGDTPGMQWILDFYVCNANSIYWEETDYLESMKKIRSFDLEYLCIAHFGVITGEDISIFLDKSISMYYRWMKFLDSNSTKLDDIQFLLDELWKTIYKDFSNIPELKLHLKAALVNALAYYKNLKQL
jgi:glyoxylase-like metal-dependent hydrolase (beta-lactamase superfamily II)